VKDYKAFLLLALGILFCAFCLSSCSSGNSAPTFVTLALTPSTAQFIDQGQTLNISLTTDTSGMGVTWTLSGAGSLSNKTTTSVTYNAPGPVSSNMTATVTATSVANTSVTAPLMITVAPPPAIATTSVTAGNQGAQYTATINATSGSPPFSWGVSSGLPGGVSLGTSTGNSITISGIPATQGSFNFTIKVTDGAGLSATQPLNLTINPPLPLAITPITLPAGTVGTAYSQTLQATGGVAPYTWAVTTGTLPAGLGLNSSSGVISGTPTTAGVGTAAFTVTVTDSELPTAMTAPANLSITINATPLSINTKSLPAGTVNVVYGATLQASGGVGPYTWTITMGTLPANLTLNGSTGVISGTPNATGTSNFTVQVADSETPTAMTFTASLSITINAAGVNNSLLNGNYAFLFHGWDPTGLFTAAGEFVADGTGNIKSGLIDTNDPFMAVSDTITGGSYSIGSNNLGTMILSFGTPISNGATSATFAFAINANGNTARFIEFDDVIGTATRGSGVIRKQDTTAFSTASIKGGYAFGFTGIDSTNNRLGLAGTFQADGAGNFTSGAVDGDAAGTLLTDVAFTATYSVASTGRGTVTLNIPGQPANLSLYVVSATELVMIETDPVIVGGISTNPILSGRVFQQTGAGSFTNASLQGDSVIYVNGLSPGSGPSVPDVLVGVVSTDGAGNFTLTDDENNGGTTTTTPVTTTGTYSVASNGRVTVTGSGKHSPVFYLVNQNEAWVVGTDNAVTTGFLEPQSAGPFSNSLLSGTYLGGSQTPVDSNVTDEVDSITADGAGNLDGTVEASGPGGVKQAQIFMANYSVASNGRVVVTQSGATVAYLYIASPTRVIFMPFGDPNPKVASFEH
jgi:hypothetical protein